MSVKAGLPLLDAGMLIAFPAATEKVKTCEDRMCAMLKDSADQAVSRCQLPLHGTIDE